MLRRAVLGRSITAHIGGGMVLAMFPSKRGKQSHEHVPDFSEGMWLGEKSLVNPSLRRDGTAVARHIVYSHKYIHIYIYIFTQVTCILAISRNYGKGHGHGMA